MREHGAGCRTDVHSSIRPLPGRRLQSNLPRGAHPPVEAFHEPVLHWLAGRDIVPVDLAIFLPFQDCIGSQFGAVVRDHHARIYDKHGRSDAGARLHTHHAIFKVETFCAALCSKFALPLTENQRSFLRFQTDPLLILMRVVLLGDQSICSGRRIDAV